MGTVRTLKASYESRHRPSSARVARSSQSQNKGLRGRWQGFTDVFTTQASATRVTGLSQTPPAYGNDEYEMLDENFYPESGTRTSDRTSTAV